MKRLLTLGLMLLLPAVAVAQKQKQKQVIDRRIIQIPKVGTIRLPGVPFFATGVTSKYWIGTGCLPVGDTLKAQLGLENGLAVNHVVEKSPAAKAGVKKHDILVAFNGKDLRSLIDLIKAIDASKGKPSTIKIVRAGKIRSIKISVTKRPKGQIAGPLDFKAFERAFKGFRGPDMKMLLVRPGIAINPSQIAIPKGTRISVRKEKKKTEINIRVDGKSYKVTNKKDIGKLPKSLQSVAKKLLERSGKVGKGFDTIRGFNLGGANPVAPKIRKRIKVRRSDDRLDQVLRELKRLRKDVDALKRGRKGDDDRDENSTT